MLSLALQVLYGKTYRVIIKGPCGNAGNMYINHIFCQSFCLPTLFVTGKIRCFSSLLFHFFYSKIKLQIKPDIHISFGPCRFMSLYVYLQHSCCDAKLNTCTFSYNPYCTQMYLITEGQISIFLRSYTLSVHLYVRSLIPLSNR